MFKVTTDPNSGRPVPPLWWRLTNLFTIWAWVMAASLAFLVYLGIRAEQPSVGYAAAAIAAVVLGVAYLNRRQVRREREAFDHRVAAYEDMISRPR